MKKILFYILTITLMVSCTDNTEQIGMSLIDGTGEKVDINSTMFDVESNSILASNVLSRGTSGYLGRVKDPETNSYVTCNYMTQVLSNGIYQFPSITLLGDYDPSKTREENINSIEAISCELCVYFNGLYGDSLALMKVVAHELDEPFKEGVSYNVDEIDNVAKTLTRKTSGSVHSQNSYTISNRVYSAKERASSSYTPNISISLNDPYTDKNNKVYNNYGTYLLRKYYSGEKGDTVNANFLDDYLFNKNVCPGFYIETVSGVGSLAKIYATQIILHFTYNDKEKGRTDTIATSFAGTEEVLQKTAVIQDKEKLQDIINNEQSYTYLKTPSGIFTELTIPVDDIMRGHENDTINTARIFIPRENNTSSEEYKFSTPSTLLVLPVDSVDSFFAKKKVTDNRTSYLISYSSSYNGYTLSNISTLVNAMYKSANKTGNWNKVVLIPVETTSSTLTSGTTQITKVSYDLALGTSRLSKGVIPTPEEKEAGTKSKIQISVIYSSYGR